MKGQSMKKKTTLKKDVDYTVETYEGRISVRLLQRGENGYFQSASCSYPNYEYIYNEETGTIEIIKLTRKQCVDKLLKMCLVNGSKMD